MDDDFSPLRKLALSAGAERALLVKELQVIAMQLRIDTLRMIHKSRSGHPGGSLSAADLFAALYFHVLNIDPGNPAWPDRDRVILSKGHACPVLYAALANRGFFSRDHLARLRQIDGILQGHPDMKKTPGVDMTTGSLGVGLAAGVGMALAARILAKSYLTYVVVGCGEMDEGIVWEAAMAASKYRLDNLIVFSDFNQLQLDGWNKDVMPLEPIEDKWRAFGWHTQRIDGHDMQMILDAIEIARKIRGLPSIIIADTIKGKGVSFMENQCEWHGKAPDDEQLRKAEAELLPKGKARE
jgi:transketolase